MGCSSSLSNLLFNTLRLATPLSGCLLYGDMYFTYLSIVSKVSIRTAWIAIWVHAQSWQSKPPVSKSKVKATIIGFSLLGVAILF
nr:MAG: hypothetical protein [Bacteriophage sp.]